MATRIPDPEHTPNGPAYQGRLLDRPDEEVVDQGASFDLGTLLRRRTLVGTGLLGFGVAALTACVAPADSTGTGAVTPSTPADAVTPSAEAGTDLPAGEIPDETAGPYPGDGSNGPDVLEQSGIVRSDIRSSIGIDDPVDGVPVEFSFTVTDMANNDVPFEGVAVYAWHCDAEGRYSMYSEGVEDQTWLRGVQVADASGTVTFTSILPGCYAGRWTHIHFEVYPDLDSITDSTTAIATSQLAFPQEVLDVVYQLPAYEGSANNLSQITLASDNVFGEDSAELQMATVTGNTDGYVASLAVRIDTTTEPTGGGAPGGPGGGGPGGGGDQGGPPPSR